jgi:hypothetical protein
LHDLHDFFLFFPEFDVLNFAGIGRSY